jgi:Domain of unknown function (DUF3291)
VPEHHLAQINIARALAATDSPELADFMAGLEPINALADRAPGFVWRLQTDDGDATAIRPYDDDRIMVNMSVWESIEALDEFVYRTGHRDYLRRRREWFERVDGSYVALWWVPAGHIPTVEEAKERLALLDEHGPTHAAFTLRSRFPAPGAVA